MRAWSLEVLSYEHPARRMVLKRALPLIVAKGARQADVPGTALCLHDLAAGPSLRTMPMPGNPVPSRSKISLTRGGRLPAFIGRAAHPLQPRPGGRADGRRWAAFAVEANPTQKAGAREPRQRQRQ